MEFFLEIANGIIETLHITSTLWIQFGLFFITFLFLTFLVFRPYYKAFEVRQEKTDGNQNTAAQMLVEADALYKDYQEAARGLNQEVKRIFDNLRLGAQKEVEQIISGSRKEAQQKIDSSAKEIGSQLESEKKKSLSEIPEISSLIRGKLLGKEMSN